MRLLKALFYIALLAVCIHLAILFGMPQFRYYSYKSEAGEIVKLDLGGAVKVKERLLEEAREYNLPVEMGQIAVSGEPGRYNAQITWSETVDVYGLYSKEFGFTVEVSRR
jgi:hypothetical protein